MFVCFTFVSSVINLICLEHLVLLYPLQSNKAYFDTKSIMAGSLVTKMVISDISVNTDSFFGGNKNADSCSLNEQK
jgi:hypothetical protein